MPSSQDVDEEKDDENQVDDNDRVRNYYLFIISFLGFQFSREDQKEILTCVFKLSRFCLN